MSDLGLPRLDQHDFRPSPRWFTGPIGRAEYAWWGFCTVHQGYEYERVSAERKAELEEEKCKIVPTAIPPQHQTLGNALAITPAVARGVQNVRVTKEMSPMPNDVTVPPEKQQELIQRATTLASRLADLRSMPVGLVMASSAQELIQDAKRGMDAVHDVFDPFVNALFKAHREATALRNKFLRPYSDVDMGARSCYREYELDRQHRIEAEKREKERLAQLEAQKQREEELAHLQAQNVPTEIIEQRAADPIIVAVPDVDEHRGKVEGTSTVDRWTGEVTDMAGFVTILATRPGLVSLLLEVVQNELNKYLTRTKGSDDFGGTVKVSFNPIIRSKGA